jgi:Asp-tRNA(Asn)/Glu-tRNA(Gln) amidotransferase C subunit
MARAAKLIVQMPIDGALDRRLREDPPASVARGEVALDAARATDDGRLEPPDVGDVVASYPSPESLRRDPEDLERAIGRAGDGVEPLVVVLEAADHLRDDELEPLVRAAGKADRGVILRVMADG